MPQLFTDANWFTSAAGKIYHDSAIDEDPQSWSYPANHTGEHCSVAPAQRAACVSAIGCQTAPSPMEIEKCAWELGP